MIKIAICEDNTIQLNTITKLIDRWSKSSGVKVKTYGFSSSESFIFEHAEDIPYDILLLDIEMKRISGIDLARLIRLKNKHVIIIFVTGNAQYALEGYEVQAINYILKPLDERKLFNCLNMAYENLNVKKSDSIVVIETPKMTYKINVDEIIYCAMFSPHIDIYLINDKITLRKKMCEIEDMLPNSLFIRPHRSYLVNMKYINVITRNCIILDNEVEIPIGRGNYTIVNEQFFSYLKGDD